MATKHHQSRQREEQEPQPELAAPVEDNPLDFSTIRNRHEDLPPPEPPKPLVGEVKAGASDPEQEDSVSVLANKPGQPFVRPPEQAHERGDVALGANEPDVVPPSVRGTSYDPFPRTGA